MNPGAKARSSEPQYPSTKGLGCQKSYPGDNRVVSGKSPHRPRGLLPRCRLFPSWSCNRDQGWGCSSLNGERELGLDRRETGWMLSIRSAGRLKGRSPQYERNRAPWPLVYRLSDRALPGSYAAANKG